MDNYQAPARRLIKHRHNNLHSIDMANSETGYEVSVWNFERNKVVEFHEYKTRFEAFDKYAVLVKNYRV